MDVVVFAEFNGGGVCVCYRAVDKVAESMDTGITTQRDEPNDCAVSGFQTYGGSCRDIEASAEGCYAIKFKSAVGFSEVEVRADLDWAIAMVKDI